jgi:hypothetical protein
MVVVANLKRPKAAGSKRASTVREKRMRTAEGKLVKVLALDANSATFIDDLTTVFEKNVAKARRENREFLGSPDGVRAKT